MIDFSLGSKIPKAGNIRCALLWRVYHKQVSRILYGGMHYNDTLCHAGELDLQEVLSSTYFFN
jgi:CRISPR/Cas system CSM-associated protein Csm5 (group 7 of RAMP superfamily)